MKWSICFETTYIASISSSTRAGTASLIFCEAQGDKRGFAKVFNIYIPCAQG